MKETLKILNRTDHKKSAVGVVTSLWTFAILSSAAFAAFMAFSASAQIQQAWVAKYNNGIADGNHQALKMTLDSAGNIYVLSVSENASSNTGYATLKYSPNGNPIWVSRYDSTNFPLATPTSFALDSAGSVAVTGNSVTVKYGFNGNQLWLVTNNAQAIAVDAGQNVYITGVSSNFTTMKLSSTGSNLWTVTDPPTYPGPANIAQAIAIDAASNIYVSGSEIYLYEQSGSLATVALIKYAANGNLDWKVNTRNYIGGTTVKIEGFMLDSAANAYISADAFAYDARYQTFKYNSDGSASWYAGNPTADSISLAKGGLVLDGIGNVLLTGRNAYYNPNYCYGTYKLDTNGNYLWGSLYPKPAIGNSTATAIAVDNANNIYVTGYSLGGNLNSDVVTLKYDSNGNQVWLQRYNGPGNGNDAGNAIAVDNSGNVYVAGYETETNGFTSMILIKYSPVTVQKQSNGNFILQAYGSPGENFDIQASTNLQSWQDLGHVIADTNGFAQFADTNASNFNSRFYFTSPQ